MDSITLLDIDDLSLSASALTDTPLKSHFSLVSMMDHHLAQNTKQVLSELPVLNWAPDAHVHAGPRFPGDISSWVEKLDDQDNELPAGENTLADDIAGFFAGSIRPHSDYALFNMVPAPSPAATAAAWLAMGYNTNTLMEAFGGGALLTEQRVARRLGAWVGWPSAMGISCSGGKMTIMYAIRSAISRLYPASLRSGMPQDVIILCSGDAHYCVEHASALLGLGADRCLRIPSGTDGRMCSNALKRILGEQHAQGKKVAAIICCGGTTINFSCEDTYEVHAIAEAFARENGLSSRPYLHLDSVIGWLYLTPFQDASDPQTRARVSRVQHKLRALDRFDSLGVDFHKNGLCPYACSFFVASDRRFMDELGDGRYRYTDDDFQPGQFRAYRYTFENSRQGHGILSAWISLRQMGRQGFENYLYGLHSARNALTRAINRHPRLKVLNVDSDGWEVVFSIRFDAALVQIYTHAALAVRFMHACWARVNAGYNLPLFSIVPEYRQRINDAAATAFLLYPMRQMSNEDRKKLVVLIGTQADIFENEMRAQGDSAESSQMTRFENPIR